MRNIVLFLFPFVFAACAPAKQSVHERLETEASRMAEQDVQLAASWSELARLRLERDSVSRLSAFWQFRAESSEREVKTLSEQRSMDKSRIEYYESGTKKSEENTSINSNRQSTSESDKRTIIEQQTQIERLTALNARLQSDSMRHAAINLNLSNKLQEQSKVIHDLKASKQQQGKRLLWWTAIGAFVGALACWKIKKISK